MGDEEPWARHRLLAAGIVPPPQHELIGTLTRWQTVILSMIGSGLTIKEIAFVMRRAPSTINEIRQTLMRKLKTDRNSVLVRYAVEAGLVATREGADWVEPAWVAKLPPIGGHLGSKAAQSQAGTPSPTSPSDAPQATKRPRRGPRPRSGSTRDRGT